MGGKIKNVLLKRITKCKIRLAKNDFIVFALGLCDDLTGGCDDRRTCEQVEAVLFARFTGCGNPDTVLIRGGLQ